MSVISNCSVKSQSFIKIIFSCENLKVAYDCICYYPNYSQIIKLDISLFPNLGVQCCVVLEGDVQFLFDAGTGPQCPRHYG